MAAVKTPTESVSKVVAAGAKRLAQVGVLAMLALGSSACGVFDFDVSQPVPEQRITGNVLGGLLGSFVPTPFPLTVNLAQEVKARGTGPVKAATLQSLSFEITKTGEPAGDADGFDFVKTIEISIESSRSNSALPKLLIADLPNPPGPTRSFLMRTIPSVNLLPYINEGSKITSTASGTVPADDVTFSGTIQIHVNTF